MTVLHLLKGLKRYEWRYHNILLLLASAAVAYYLFQADFVQRFIDGLGGLGYVGTFFVGAMFAYGFSTPVAIALLLLLGHSLNPLLIAAIGASGAMISDYLIFRFVRDKLSRDIMFLIKDLGLRLDGHRIRRWKPFIPLIAGFIIASPLPDELASALLGGIHFNPRKFLLYSYVFNFIGILLISSVGMAF
ncbi:MAG: hypothetical protein HYX24_00960 [Candidatus Aenigmarchaeota archaeon]|nr:hypothetical protein [Candidatus Aenigmarchaeota archaeon]